MLDMEYRIMLTGDRHGVETAAVFRIEDDGQVALVDAWEVSPFTTKRDLLDRIIRVVLGADTRWKQPLR